MKKPWAVGIENVQTREFNIHARYADEATAVEAAGWEGTETAGIEVRYLPVADVLTHARVKNVRIYLNRNIDMTPGKAAAQAVHAALLAYGIEHGSVVVLQGSPTKINDMAVQVHDAGLTELEPGTLTAGASLEERCEARRGGDPGEGS